MKIVKKLSEDVCLIRQIHRDTYVPVIQEATELLANKVGSKKKMSLCSEAVKKRNVKTLTASNFGVSWDTGMCCTSFESSDLS